MALIERLAVDRVLRRICGFARWKQLPDEATSSCALAEFTIGHLAEPVHEALIKARLGQELIGHISRADAAILARERPVRVTEAEAPVRPTSSFPTEVILPEAAPAPIPPRRGCPKRGEVRAPKTSRIERQRSQSLAQMIDELPKHCDRGAKCHAQGYKVSWNGYQLHLDTADCGVVGSALLTSASMNDSPAVIPLSLMTARRVTNLYDLKDAASQPDLATAPPRRAACAAERPQSARGERY